MNKSSRKYYIKYIFLLVLIVEATSNTSNETSHERRQSRVTGRIVKLYSGTRPEPILCSGEGFQADPHECTVFYRCMKSGNGKYTVFKFQCGPETVYDPETEVCNHPRSTKRIECGGHSPPSIGANNNEIEDTRNEIPSPITGKPKYTNRPIHSESITGSKAPTITTQIPWLASSPADSSEMSMVHTSSYPWGPSVGHTFTGHTVNPGSLLQYTERQNQNLTELPKLTSLPSTFVIPPSSIRDNICTSNGFMGDSLNCRKFYRCVANHRGAYTRYEFSCSEATIWDDDTQSCNHAWAVKRSRCGKSNQHNDNQADIPQKESSKDKTSQQQQQVSYGSKVTQIQTQISTGSVTQNQTQINYGDRYAQNQAIKGKQNQTQISHGSATSQTQTQIDYSNKGVQTQLQIDHSRESSQSQLQVHGATTKGIQTSADSSTSHVSIQDSNKCNKLGYIGDAIDCKKFYRCIDNERGGYTKFEFSCGEGTVWDQNIEACNHAWAVKECGGKYSSEIMSTTHAAVSTTESTQNYYTTVSTENYHMTSDFAIEENEGNGYGHQNKEPLTLSSTTVVPSTMTYPPKGDCQSSGFIGDAKDCKVFYRCVENSKGSFTKYEFKCGEGTVWDPELEACNHVWAVKKCGVSTTPDINKVEPTTDKQTTSIIVHTQNTTVTYLTTESAATQNEAFDTGYGSVSNDFSSVTTTSTNQPQIINITAMTCQSSGFIGDQSDCKKFYRCVDNGNGGYTRYEFACGESTVWDSKIEACNHVWAVEKCGRNASTDINKLEPTTDKTTTSFIIHTQSPTVTHSTPESAATQNDDYDTGYGSANNEFTILTTSSTNLPQTVDHSTDRYCQYSGFIGDKSNCKKFYRCVDNGNGGFTRYEFTCGEGTVWDSKIEACNHAWAVKNCGEGVTIIDQHEATTQSKPTTSQDIVGISVTESDKHTGSPILIPSTTYSISTATESISSVDKDCTYGGFMGDHKDCKKFYRCLDNGNGSYTKYEFSCGEGTVWDQEIEACNHVWAVKKCGGTVTSSNDHHETTTQYHPTVSDEIDNGYPANVDAGSGLTAQSTTTQLTTEGSKEANNCINTGFMGDKNDCKKFYRCVNDGKGGFIRYEFSCGDGTLWDATIEACNHVWAVKDCGKSRNDTMHTQSESTTKVTIISESEDQGYPQYAENTSISAVALSTVDNINEHPTQTPQVSSGVCSIEGFYGDQSDCKKFYRCVDNGKGSYTKYEFSCGDGAVWDQEIGACNHESGNNRCSSSSIPSTSQTVSQSEDGADNSFSTSTTIQHSTEKTEASSTSSSNQCTSEGFFSDTNDCTKFIRCLSNSKGGYIKYEFSCGEGTIWVQDILACDHDTGDAICSSQTTTKPLTTEGYQQTTKDNEPSTSTIKPQTIDKQEDEYGSGDENKPSISESGDCYSEGFHANRNNCRQFYRCVDNGQGGYTKYNFTCSDGTAWDADIQGCNHIDQVKTCQGASEPNPIMHDEENTQTTEYSSTMKTTTTGSSHNTTLENKNLCENEGYFGDTQDCTKFYRCVDNGKNEYKKYDYTCGEGTIWDMDVTTCNHPRDVTNPSCNQIQNGTATSMTTASSSSSSSSEATITTTENTQITTENNQSTTENTQSSTNCSQEETSKKPDNQNITCTKGGYYANPNDCKKFYRCVDWDGDGKRFSVYHFECGDGTIWDPAVETCNHEESVYPPRDCSSSQSQSENQSPEIEGSTTTQLEPASSQESTTTEKIPTPQSSTGQTTQSTTSEQTTTQQSTSSEPTTTQQSTSEQMTTQQSTTSEEMTTQKSTTANEQTTTQTSMTSDQTTQQSTTSEQTPTQLTTSEQTTTQSTTSEQTTIQQSTTSEQTDTQQPMTSEQTTQESTSSEQPTTSEQTTEQQSTTSESTQTTTTTTTSSESTTEQSSSTSTEESINHPSTTTEQAEQSTSGESTSNGTTTEVSNTAQSTTEQTNEISTTESGSDENASDKKCPEANEDQNLFLCPTSFKRHPKYCNLFYQCDEDDDTHDVKLAIFTCPNNTIYDENQTRCVNESKADKKCDGKIAQKRRYKRLNRDYNEPIVVTTESHACSSAGYFSFEKDSECSSAFLKCKTDKTNKLRGLVYQCPSGYVYWSISKRCELINRVKDCKRSHNNWTGRWEIPVERRNVAPT